MGVEGEMFYLVSNNLSLMVNFHVDISGKYFILKSGFKDHFSGFKEPQPKQRNYTIKNFHKQLKNMYETHKQNSIG